MKRESKKNLKNKGKEKQKLKKKLGKTTKMKKRQKLKRCKKNKSKKPKDAKRTGAQTERCKKPKDAKRAKRSPVPRSPPGSVPPGVVGGCRAVEDPLGWWLGRAEVAGALHIPPASHRWHRTPRPIPALRTQGGFISFLPPPQGMATLKAKSWKTSSRSWKVPGRAPGW